jgi:hypothetical protein
MRVTLHLSISDVLLLIEGLWQLGDVLPRNSGAVRITGDLPSEDLVVGTKRPCARTGAPSRSWCRASPRWR